MRQGHKLIRIGEYVFLAVMLVIAVTYLLTYNRTGYNAEGHGSMIASHAAQPLYGVKDILLSGENDKNISAITPDTKETIDVWYPENPLDATEKAKESTTFRYFKLAEGIPISAFSIGEGVNQLYDQLYKGDPSKDISDDEFSPKTVIPLTLPPDGVITSDGPDGEFEEPDPYSSEDISSKDTSGAPSEECYGFLASTHPTWKQPAGQYIVDVTGSRFTSEEAVRLVNEAMQVWNDKIVETGGTPVFTGAVAGTVPDRSYNRKEGTGLNGVNEIYFNTQKSNTIAMMSTQYVAQTDIVEADMFVNLAYFGPGTEKYNIDFRSIMIHELGHALGLNHPSLSDKCLHEIMYASYQGLKTKLGLGDSKGLQILYGKGAVTSTVPIDNQTATLGDSLNVYANAASSAAGVAKVINPNVKRWGANPELYTLSQDYLGNFKLNNYTRTQNITVDNLPAVIFVLYDSPHNSLYYQVDATKRDYSSKSLYFDAYYSMEMWNAENGTPSNDKLPDWLGYILDQTKPDDFGYCKYIAEGAVTPDAFTVLARGVNISTDHPKVPQPPASGPPRGVNTGLVDPTGSGDVKFTLIDSSNKPGTDNAVTQSNINKWTKYELIEMLDMGTFSFEIDRKNTEPYLDKDLAELDGFTEKNNLIIPRQLYSKQAYELAKSTPYAYPYNGCAGAPDEEKCAYEASLYDVDFVPEIDNSTTVNYHNRKAILNKRIYARQILLTDTEGLTGAHPKINLPTIADWNWCWFTPE